MKYKFTEKVQDGHHAKEVTGIQTLKNDKFAMLLFVLNR